MFAAYTASDRRTAPFDAPRSWPNAPLEVSAERGSRARPGRSEQAVKRLGLVSTVLVQVPVAPSV